MFVIMWRADRCLSSCTMFVEGHRFYLYFSFSDTLEQSVWLCFDEVLVFMNDSALVLFHSAVRVKFTSVDWILGLKSDRACVMCEYSTMPSTRERESVLRVTRLHWGSADLWPHPSVRVACLRSVVVHASFITRLVQMLSEGSSVFTVIRRMKNTCLYHTV